MSDITVPADLLPALRENIRLELGQLGDALETACDAGYLDEIAKLCEGIESVIAAHRALAPDADSYPSGAVHLAARRTIEDVEARLADDSNTIDEAEKWVRQARGCEALLAAIEPQAVTS